MIFFDGVCNLCNSSVQFVLKKDKNQKFKFASLQSDVATEILLQFSKKKSELNSIILVYNNRIYEKSAAILHIARLLGAPYTLTAIFWIFPKPVRNYIYDFIAKNRYKWFGKTAHCMTPSPKLKERFLE